MKERIIDAVTEDRSQNKLIRDTTAMLIGFVFLFGAFKLMERDPSPELAIITGPLSLYGWRLVRKVLGNGPS